MAQSGLDPTEKSYGVFINSNQSSNLTTEKSNVTIPFQANLADHDPSKAVQVAMTSFLFTNTIYNITEVNNEMRVLTYYRAGRGLPASLVSRDIVIPPGFYNITQLSNYLSKSGIMGKELVQTLFRYIIQGVAQESFVDIYEGFGAIPLDPNDPVITKAAPTNDSNTKIVFQSPDLAHMVQYGTDLITPCTPALKHSYIYEAIYVECPPGDTSLSPLLKMLGFFNIKSAPAKLIPESVAIDPTKPRFGYGLQFDAFEATPSNNGIPVIPAIDNTVYYRVRGLESLSQSVILQTPQPFHGIVAINQSVILTCAYELRVDNTLITLNNGFFVSGGSLSVPSPYVVGFQECEFTATFTNNQDIMDNVVTTFGNLSVGMAIGVEYDPDTGIPVDLVAANLFNYATGTTPPGLENLHCFYIVEILSATQYRLNQKWNSNSGAFTLLYGSCYVLTSVQINTPGGLVENMLASPTSVSDITGVYTPSNVTNLSGVDEIHVHCSQLRTQNLSSTSFQALAPSDVIAVVPVEVEFGFKQNYQPPNPLTSYLSNTNVNQLDMELTDAKGMALDFNGVDWSCTLFITEVDAMNNTQLNSSGNFNTPFQDQLSQLEGTAQAQNKRQQREIIFYESSRKRNVGGHRPHYY
jgi:hypothetical protein